MRTAQLRSEMRPGAWGARAGVTLEAAAAHRGVVIHRSGELAMLDQPHVSTDGWLCWLFGEPEDRGVLAQRFGEVVDRVRERGDVVGLDRREHRDP